MFFNKKTKQIWMFVYGEGGHEAQMNRFAPNLLNKLDNYYAITLSDSKKKPLWADEHFITQEFRNKYAWVNVLKNLGPLNIFLKTFLIIRRTNCRAIVTTGPGIAISAAIAAKLLNVKIIHIETWSRFTTRSFSGRIMYHLASKFYVQNESLLQLYPKAIFSGRL